MEEVLFDRTADRVARITRNHPEVKNALSIEVRERLAALFTELGVDSAMLLEKRKPTYKGK